MAALTDVAQGPAGTLGDPHNSVIFTTDNIVYFVSSIYTWDKTFYLKRKGKLKRLIVFKN